MCLYIYRRRNALADHHVFPFKPDTTQNTSKPADGVIADHSRNLTDIVFYLADFDAAAVFDSSYVIARRADRRTAVENINHTVITKSFPFQISSRTFPRRMGLPHDGLGLVR